MYVLDESGDVIGVYATLEGAIAAAGGAGGWTHIPSVKGSRPMWWRGLFCVEAWEVQP